MKTINIQNAPYKVADFLSWSRNNTLTLNPEFQRRAIWKPGTKSYLIDTMVRGFPIPPIFLRDRGITRSFEPLREVIDGQQRLRTVLGFIDPKLVDNYDPEKDDFTVKKAHNLDLAGKKFNALSDDVKRNILEYEFSVYTLSSDVDDREVIQIFRRMNSTTYTLNAQELRNASFSGAFKTSAYQLAAEQLPRWRNWKVFTVDNIARMYEVELTNEFMILMLRGELARNTKTATNKIYEQYEEVFPQQTAVEERFRVVIDTISDRVSGELANSRYRKSLIYSLFAYFYDVQYGLKSDLTRKASPRSVSTEQISRVKLAIERIDKGNASERVIRAIKKSTTDTASRKALFDYLRG